VVGEHGRAHLDEAVYSPLRKRRRILAVSLAAITMALVVALFTLLR